MLKTVFVFVLLAVTFIATVLAGNINVRTIVTSEKLGTGVLTGPESLLFDPNEPNVLYTGIADGSIRKFNVETGETTLFGYSVPNLDATVRATCGASVLNEPTCGRVLGLAWTGEGDLLVADAYKGLLKISKSNPSNVQVLVNSYNGVPLKFTNSVVMLKDNRTVYFTDSSTLYSRMQFVATVVSSKPDGRLFKLDLITNELTVILEDLEFANGIALSEDEKFMVINECSARKIRRYWLKGPKAGLDDVFVDDIGGYNDNIVADGNGNFLVALYSYTANSMSAIQEHEDLGVLVNKYIPPADTLGLIKRMGVVKRIDDKGRVKEVFEDLSGLQSGAVSEAHEHNGYLYLGSVLNPYLTRVNKFTGLQ